MFDLAAQQVRPGFESSSWAAFWQTAVEGKAAADVAENLNISVGAVYIARRRAIARIRQKVQELEEQ